MKRYVAPLRHSSLDLTAPDGDDRVAPLGSVVDPMPPGSISTARTEPSGTFIKVFGGRPRAFRSGSSGKAVTSAKAPPSMRRTSSANGRY